MLLPTVPPALMLLPLGSLSNLMKSSTAVCPASYLPPHPPQLFLGKKTDLSAFFFFGCCRMGDVLEEENGSMINFLGQDWPRCQVPHCSPNAYAIPSLYFIACPTAYSLSPLQHFHHLLLLPPSPIHLLQNSIYFLLLLVACTGQQRCRLPGDGLSCGPLLGLRCSSGFLVPLARGNIRRVM